MSRRPIADRQLAARQQEIEANDDLISLLLSALPEWRDRFPPEFSYTPPRTLEVYSAAHAPRGDDEAAATEMTLRAAASKLHREGYLEVKLHTHAADARRISCSCVWRVP